MPTSPRAAWAVVASGLVVTVVLVVACNRKSNSTVEPAGPVEPVIHHDNEDPYDGPAWFEDVTATAGIQVTYRNGEEANNMAIIESLGGGVAAFDYDGDGRIDLYFTGGGYYEGKKVLGHPGKLYRNLGNWKFQDVTKEVGLDTAVQYSHGVAVGDVDRDGFPDLLVTGYDRLALYMNVPAEGGGRKFANRTEQARLTEKMWSAGAACADLDGDGYPDLYVCHYGDWGFDSNHPLLCTYDGSTRDVCQPRKFKPLPHTLYRNNRDGTFTDVSEQVKLRKDGKGLGVLLVDLNNDGRPDIYVANDTDENHLYVNRGKRGELVLEEMGVFAGVALDDNAMANGSMGIDAGNFARSGLPSLIVTNYENELPALYRNRCDGQKVRFDFDSKATGIAAVGGSYVSWGTGFFDYDL